jgi:hypothetical protein
MDLIRRLQILGYGLVGGASVLGVLAVQNMRSLAAYGYLCGGALPHCPACPASLAALALGVSVLAGSRRGTKKALAA